MKLTVEDRGEKKSRLYQSVLGLDPVEMNTVLFLASTRR